MLKRIAFALALMGLVASSPQSLAQCPNDDSITTNNDCASAVAGTLGSTTGLIVIEGAQDIDDYWSYLVPAGNVITISAIFLDANGDVDIEIYDDAGTCGNEVADSNSSSDDEFVTWTNTSANPHTIVLRVRLFSGGCNTYDLLVSVFPDPCTDPTLEDSFEDNDDCATATPLTAGTYLDLFARKRSIDEDNYVVTIQDQQTLTVTISFTDAVADIDMSLLDACGTPFAVDASAGSGDMEQVTYTNTTGGPLDLTAVVFLWDSASNDGDCNSYDMVIDVTGGNPFLPYCFGDGSGTACPCGNNSAVGHQGGCANSVGDGAVLAATGAAAVSMDTLNLDLSSASLNSFALLVSGDNQLPQMGCVGCGIQAFDGLRCAGGNFLRHGSRSTDSMGETGNGWGPPGGPAGGLISANGFTAGQTKHFFAFYRDDINAVCMTGQNSSNGVSITFQP